MKTINDCPFCGESVHVYVSVSERNYAVECYACGASGPNFYRYIGCEETDAMAYAIESWNNCGSTT